MNIFSTNSISEDLEMKEQINKELDELFSSNPNCTPLEMATMTLEHIQKNAHRLQMDSVIRKAKKFLN